MSQTLHEAGVIPDVIQTGPSPDLGLVISYGDEELQSGAKVPRQETTVKVPDLKLQNPPEGQQAGTSSTYTIIMTDPDLFVQNDPTGQVRVSSIHGNTVARFKAHLLRKHLYSIGYRRTYLWNRES